MVKEVSGVLRILHESLYGIFREELAIWFGDPPKNLCVELPGRRRREEVDLTVERIENLVQPSRYVPPM